MFLLTYCIELQSKSYPSSLPSTALLHQSTQQRFISLEHETRDSHWRRKQPDEPFPQLSQRLRESADSITGPSDGRTGGRSSEAWIALIISLDRIRPLDSLPCLYIA